VPTGDTFETKPKKRNDQGSGTDTSSGSKHGAKGHEERSSPRFDESRVSPEAPWRAT
jgi:hypothetical protein